MNETIKHSTFVEIVIHAQPKTTERMWVRLIPDGEVDSESGNFIFDEQAAGTVMKIFRDRQVAIVVDYGHGSIDKFAPSDGVAPAAGWIEDLRHVVNDGLYGLVRWTDRALAMLKADEARYLSPAVYLDKESKRVIRLDSVGLVHKPAIKGGLSVAASRSVLIKENQEMPPEPTDTGEVTPDQKIGKIESLLEQKGVSLPEGASRDAILDAVIEFLKGGPKEGGEESTEVAASVRKELGLKENAGKEQVVMALARLKDASGAQQQLLTLRAELDELKEKDAEQTAHALRDRYVKGNKINPHSERVMANALAWAKRDPKGFEQWHEDIPASVPPGRTTASARSPTSGGGEDELIANALKEYDGKYGEAIVALQCRLLAPMKEEGLTQAAANKIARERYPKIFGAAA